ncbi:MAG TPA: hypothetical protein VHI13_08395 [Candidatus Kapabacteria bacterium]|nr:hypothetical protein [Candidatus Kapabacteria bacterium]
MTTQWMRAAGAAVLLALLAAGSAHAQSDTKKVTMVNKTKFNIHEVYLSHVSKETWEEDLLGPKDIMEPGDKLEITVSCGDWDVKLVAADGSTCEVRNVTICDADEWDVTADCGS